MNLRYIKMAINAIKIISFVYNNHDKIVSFPRNVKYNGHIYRVPMDHFEWKLYIKWMKANTKIKIIKLSKNMIELVDI